MLRFCNAPLFLILVIWPILLDAQTLITDTNIQTAVDQWLSDPSEAEDAYGHISTWNTSAVTDMSGLFEDKNAFNDDISNWEVSAVTDMNNMFKSVSETVQ